jgi:anhydro-N-acetylmuramic acid kinase
MKKEYHIIGTMSGTSLDGLDLALCKFSQTPGGWNYSIERAKTYTYTKEWTNKLSGAENLSGLELLKLHNDFGKLTGNYINDFLQNNVSDVDFISSHGHTVFHQPSQGYTLQIGSGAYIAANTGITTICDFRTLDVALGGQGAPLVPIGDKLLFSEYEYCLNLGGFANISFDENEKRIAFDICPVNIVINHLASQAGIAFDKDGNLGKNGNLDANLLHELDNLPFYYKKGPKSLGKEWILAEFIPILNKYPLKPTDKIRTVYEHIAVQIGESIKSATLSKVLVTGGGTHNKFLMELLQSKIRHNFILPSKKIIDYKEALIFAFLGLLRYLETTNCLKSVTSASTDNIGGIIYKIKADK